MNISYPIQTLIPIRTTVGRVEVDGYTIEYITAGKGPPLLLLHGANIGWIQWYNVIAPLSKSYTVYAFDWPGSGNSTPIDYSTLNIHFFIRILGGFIRRLRLKDVRIIAHSVSGAAALFMAHSNPANIKKLILVDSMGFTNYLPPSNYPIAFRFIARFIAQTVMKPTKVSMRSFLESVLVKPVLLPEEFVEHFYQNVIRAPTHHPLYFMHALTQGFKIKKEYGVQHLLGQVNTRLFILHGTHDPLIPIACIQPVIRRAPGVKFQSIQSGHVPSLESPDEFLSLVKAFLH